MHLVMTSLVLVSGLFVALAGDASPGMRLFGWLLVAIGALGLVIAVFVRSRPRG